MQTAKWRSLQNFPKSDGSWEVLVSPINFRRSGERRVQQAINKALLLNPVLVSTPETNGRFVPPIVAAPDHVGAKLVRDSRSIFIMTFAFWVVGVLLSLTLGQLQFAVVWGVVFGTTTVLALQMRRNAADQDALRERWQFFGWCSLSGSIFAMSFLLFMVALGALQLIGISLMNGQASFLNRFGLLYVPLWDQDFWRVLTAPFIHANAAHWIINAVVGSALFSIIGSICGWRLILLVFSLAATLSLVLTSLLSPIIDWGAQGIVGISGGISALFGLLLAMTFRFPRLFPKGFLQSIILTAIVLLLASPVFFNLGGFAAHITGLIIGCLAGFLVDPVDPEFLQDVP